MNEFSKPFSDEVLLCVFRIGTEHYVLDLKRIDEILPVPKLTALPRAPIAIEGVINLRGSVLPVIDARKRLGTPLLASLTSASKKKERLMVCRIGKRRIGLIVDAVVNVMRTSRSALRPTPALSQTRPVVMGVCGNNDDLKLMLDLSALIKDETRV